MTAPRLNDAAIDGAATAEGGDRAEVPILYTIEEAARLLRLSRTTLYELMWNDKLVPIRIGRRVRFTRACLERFVEEWTQRC
jgi:excisionase family DNA binding protein